jgi:hypothetical protein
LVSGGSGAKLCCMLLSGDMSFGFIVESEIENGMDAEI